MSTWTDRTMRIDAVRGIAFLMLKLATEPEFRNRFRAAIAETMSKDDPWLIEALDSFDRAFDDVVSVATASEDRLRGIAVGFKLTEHDFEDRYHDTLIKLMESKHIYRCTDDSQVISLVNTFFRNTCRDFFRRRRTAHVLCDPDELDVVSGPVEDASVNAIGRVDVQSVFHGDSPLMPDDRIVLMLRVYTGLTRMEIADILGVTEATVTNRTNRAIDKARHFLE